MCLALKGARRGSEREREKRRGVEFNETARHFRRAAIERIRLL